MRFGKTRLQKMHEYNEFLVFANFYTRCLNRPKLMHALNPGLCDEAARDLAKYFHEEARKIEKK